MPAMTTKHKTAAQIEAEVRHALANPPGDEYARMVAGDAELEGRGIAAKIIRKGGKVPRTGAQGGPLMGYTDSKKPVHGPSRPGAPNMNDAPTFIKTKAKFPGWTNADFMDAANLYDHASIAAALEGDRKRARDLSRWSDAFWDMGGRWTTQAMEARHGERPRGGGFGPR